jgi:hypothetical protein
VKERSGVEGRKTNVVLNDMAFLPLKINLDGSNLPTPCATVVDFG